MLGSKAVTSGAPHAKSTVYKNTVLTIYKAMND